MLSTGTRSPDRVVGGTLESLRPAPPPAHAAAAGWLRASHARLWDDGCRRDGVRNQFVIPALVEALRLSGHSRVIDLGAGTAYVLAELRRRGDRPSGVRFTAVEQEPSLCEWLDCAYGREWLDVERRNFLDGRAPNRSAALVIGAYSLLEVEGSRLGDLKSSLRFGDTLVVSVASQAVTNRGAELEVRRPHKVDRFTGLTYPLFEHRIVTLIEVFAAFGARLVASRTLTTASKDRHWVLAFHLDG